MFSKRSTFVSTSKTPITPHKTPKAHHGDLSSTDARLQRVSDKILPKSPYLLTVPSDRPYRPTPQQLSEWHKGSPFAPDEAPLQYLSFLSRDWDDGLLRVVGGWDNEKGEMMDTATIQANGARSGTSTPQPGGGPKKKISLSDYKSKAAGIGVVKPMPKVSENAAALPEVNGTSAPIEKLLKAPEVSQHGQKRPLEVATDDSKKCAPSETKDVTPPAKKARLSPPRPSITPEKPKPQQTKKSLALPPLLSPTLPPSIEEELSKILKSPPYLNGHPEHKKTDSSTSSSSEKKPSSSRKLSPPMNEEAKVSQTDNSITLSNKSANKSSSVIATPTKVTQHNPKLAEPSKALLDTKPRPSNSNAAERSIKVTGNAGAKPAQRSDSNARKEPVTPTKAPPKAVKETKLLRFKIAKNRRTDFRRIVNMKPRPKKADPGSIARREDREETSKDKVMEKDKLSISDKDRDRHRQDRDSFKSTGEVRKDRSENLAKQTFGAKDGTADRTKAVEKRRRSNDDGEAVEPASKRPKPLAGLDLTQKPRTPIPPPFKSPALSQQGSAQKPQVSTPMRDVRGVAMRRIESGEGDAKTPQGRVGTPTAPGSAEKINRNGRSVSITSSATTNSLSGGRAEEASAWKAENKKYIELGRTLKHHADPLINPKEHTKAEPNDRKVGAAIAIETVLSYMLAFTANDETTRIYRTPRDIKGWDSMLPYLEYLKPRIHRYPFLYGLCLQLEAICRDTLHTANLDRLDREPLPTPTVEATHVPTPGANADTAPPAEASAKASKFRDYMEFKSSAVDNARRAQKLWVEGTSKLSVAALQQHFPATWEAKAKVPLAWTSEAAAAAAATNGTTTESATECRTAEKLVPGKWAGEFYLPLSCSSLPIEAARAGYSLLKEWCEIEGVRWEGKLRL